MKTKRYCSNCAAAIEPGDEFCSNCGAAAEAAETPPPPAPQKSEVPTPVAPETSVVQPAAVEGANSHTSYTRQIVIGLSILLAGLVVGGGLVSFLNGDRTDNAVGADTDGEPSPGVPLPQNHPSKATPPVKDRVPPAFSKALLVYDHKSRTGIEVSESKEEEMIAPIRVDLEPAQFGSWVIEASSAAKPQSGNRYGPENLVDSNSGVPLSTSAWIEGVAGDGIGEWVRFTFGGKDDSLTLSTLTIVNGYGKSVEIFRKNNRVRELRVGYAEGEETVILQDLEYPQKIRLKRPVTTSWLRLTIGSVYKGNEDDDTAISDVRFDIESFNYYPPLEGRELKSPDGQLSAWLIPVINQDEGDQDQGGGIAESLVQIWDSKAATGEMPAALGSFDHSSDSGTNGRCATQASWTPDSQFFVYTTVSSGGHSPWNATGYFFDRKSGLIHCLDDFGIVVLEESFTTEAPDVIVVLSQRQAGDLDGERKKVRLSSIEMLK